MNGNLETRDIRREIEEIDQATPEKFAQVGEMLVTHGLKLSKMIGVLALVRVPTE
jgi:hypothetical protein